MEAARQFQGCPQDGGMLGSAKRAGRKSRRTRPASRDGRSSAKPEVRSSYALSC